MSRSFSFIEAAALWVCVVYLVIQVPHIETRVDDTEQLQVNREQPSPHLTPEPEIQPKYVEVRPGECFHMPRSSCLMINSTVRCAAVDPVSVLCCDIQTPYDLKEGLLRTRSTNTTQLHVLNAQLKTLNLSDPLFKTLESMSFTDGKINEVVGMFKRHSLVTCLNISNNNLSSNKSNTNQRPFAYLPKLTLLDASANNLTEFPLSLAKNRNIEVDFHGNDYLPCSQFQTVMESFSLVTFRNFSITKCILTLNYGAEWIKETEIVSLDYVKDRIDLNDKCREIKPPNANCTCARERITLLDDVVTNVISVDCSNRNLTEMPFNLPNNTVKLNVSYNKISSLSAVDDPSYNQLQQLIVDYNEVTDFVDLEGTKFIDNFMLFSIQYNKLKTLHPHVFSNKFVERVQIMGDYTTFSVAGNYIDCDCNTEKVLKPWLIENYRNIPDYRSLYCKDDLGPVVDLWEFQVCHLPRDWTDYIYYIIALEVLVLVLLISKVSYDYWVFKTAGYLPWPANKMPRLPCDWLCE